MEYNLYIIRMFGRDTSILKMGYSSNIKDRIACYIAHNPLIEVVSTYYREDAKEFEILFHKSNESLIRREFYKEDELDMIVDAIENKSLSDFVKLEKLSREQKTLKKQEHEMNQLSIKAEVGLAVTKRLQGKQRISSKECKQIFKELFELLGYEATPKASLLSEFYNKVEETQWKESGIKITGYNFSSPKYILHLNELSK